jgi:hypothetical protein
VWTQCRHFTTTNSLDTRTVCCFPMTDVAGPFVVRLSPHQSVRPCGGHGWAQQYLQPLPPPGAPDSAPAHQGTGVPHRKEGSQPPHIHVRYRCNSQTYRRDRRR